MTKEELALEVIDRLKKEYPLADCTLDYDEAWKLFPPSSMACSGQPVSGGTVNGGVNLWRERSPTAA